MLDARKVISEIPLEIDPEERAHLLKTIYSILSIEPNDPCWCLSSKIFEECHKDREKQRKLHPQESNRLLLQFSNKDKYCCAAFDATNCLLPIKGAHTIQKSRVLSGFAKDGHVGTLYQNIDALTNPKKIKSGFKKNASVFYGFCDFHDTELFKEIEIDEFKLTPKNCWATSYRAVCHEYYQKKSGLEALEWLLMNMDRGEPLYRQIQAQTSLSIMKKDFSKGFFNISIIKDKYEGFYLKSDFSSLKSYIVEFDAPLVIATSGTVSPFFTISGKRFQNTGNPFALLEAFALSTVAINNNGTYVISFLETHSKIGKYLQELFGEGNVYLKKWLFKTMFAHLENTYFDIDWWYELDGKTKKEIYKIAVTENYTYMMPYDDLVSKHISGNIKQVTFL